MDSLAAQMSPSTLRSFFSSFNSLQALLGEDEEKAEKQRLESFFEKYAILRREFHESGSDFNIWRIAGLTHKEAPPTRILAWFLDGEESHAMGSVFMESLLSLVPDKCWARGKRPEKPDSDYRVMTELPFRNRDFMTEEEILQECDEDIPETGEPADLQTDQAEAEGVAEGNEAGESASATETGYKPSGSRPDVFIASRDFLLIIEAKTQTGEHDRQLSRYARIAESIAPNKPWAVVYLTKHGGSSGECERACPLAWHSVARMFRKALKGKSMTPAAIVCEHFCEYIENL